MLAIDVINKRACRHKYIMQLTPAAIFRAIQKQD